MIVTPVAKVPSALLKSRESNPSPVVLCTGAAWLPTVSSCPMSSTTAAPSDRRIGRQSERHPAIDCEVDLDIGEIGDVFAGISAEPVAGRHGEMLDGIAGDTERDAGDGEGKQADGRQLIQGPRIDFAAAIGTALDPLGGERAVGWNK